MRTLALIALALLVAPLAAAQQTPSPAPSGLQVVVDAQELHASPGTTFAVNATVTNTLGRPLAVHVEAPSPDPARLDLKTSPSDLTLKPGASAIVRVYGLVGGNAPNGTIDVAVKARENTTNAPSATTQPAAGVGHFNVTIVRPFAAPPPTSRPAPVTPTTAPSAAPGGASVVVSLERTRATARPGESIRDAVKVTNMRDAPTTIELTTEADAPLVAHLGRRLVDLPPRATVTVPLDVDVPADAQNGTAIVSVAASGPTLDAPASALLGVTIDASTAPPAAAGQSPLLSAVRSVPTGAWVAAGGTATVGGLGAALYAFRRKAWAAALLAPLYTRIAKNKVLDQPLREKIAELVQAEPGITFGDLERRLDIAAGQLTHHARMLEEAGVIFSTPDGQQRRFFHVGHGRVAAVPPMAERALATLQTSGPMTLSALSKAMGVSKQALHYHVKKMQADGRVSIDESQRIVPVVMVKQDRAP